MVGELKMVGRGQTKAGYRMTLQGGKLLYGLLLFGKVAMKGSASGLPTGTSTAGATAGFSSSPGDSAGASPGLCTGSPDAMEMTPAGLQGRVYVWGKEKASPLLLVLHSCGLSPSPLQQKANCVIPPSINKEVNNSSPAVKASTWHNKRREGTKIYLP